MDVEQPFGARVIGFEHVVADRPRGRHALLVPERAEILEAQAVERAAVDLRVAADDVVQPGVELVTGTVLPDVGALVLAVDEHGLARPVGAFALQIVAALEDEDALAGRRQLERHRPAAGPRADDDDVVVPLADARVVAHRRLRRQ